MGDRLLDPREEFASKQGIKATETATLDFRRYETTVSLHGPTRKETVRMGGKVRPLAPDFSPPIGEFLQVPLFRVANSTTRSPR